MANEVVHHAVNCSRKIPITVLEMDGEESSIIYTEREHLIPTTVLNNWKMAELPRILAKFTMEEPSMANITMGPSVPSTVEDLLNNDVQLQNEGQMVVP